MQIIERYARSAQSSNLRDNEHNHQTEPLAAAALCEGVGVAKIGAILWRVKYSNDATSYKSLLEKWSDIVKDKSISRKWPSHIVPATVAKTSLDYFLNDTCPVCLGRGHPLIDGARPVLSDDDCDHCQGQGKRPMDCNGRLRDYCRDMVETLSEIQRYAASQVMKKLSDNMNSLDPSG